MNLLHEPWMPVRLSDGRREWIAPSRLSDPAVVAFDADRADFNGALAQFSIGLLQTCSPAQSQLQWKRLFESPPDAETLQEWFEPHVAAFELDGDGPRFMQDFVLRTGDGDTKVVNVLLIETPGDKTVLENGDHFVKRNNIRQLCPHCACTALVTLQTNAPPGGAGNRTSIRGGGPLTTLLLAESRVGSATPLWRTLWLNVMGRAAVRQIGGDEALEEQFNVFPWMSAVDRIQKPGGETAPSQVHPLHVYWGMPRRIRLDFETVTTGDCEICGRHSDRRIQQYAARPHGLNYKGPWRHPLSPYYKTKDGMLPVHPQQGGFGYRHWLGWVLGMSVQDDVTEPALVVSEFLSSKIEDRFGVNLRLWASGYDIKPGQAKVRCWYEATMPIYDLGECDAAAQAMVRDTVTSWISGAELAASYLRGAVKDAWFSHDARGDFSHVDASFWARTEGEFYRLLKRLIHAARSDAATPTKDLTEEWLGALRRHVTLLFDAEWVGTGPIERQNPARIAKANEQLRKSLYGPKLRAALALEVEAKPAKKKAGKASPAAKRTQ